MSTLPQVSVALSTFNGERFLREQLDSLLAQRDVSLEIVAVDDGSNDSTRAILAEYAERDARVSWHANPSNLGPTRSFERALSLCRGEFLAPCDQDDVWHPDKLAVLLGAIGDSDLVYCDSEFVDEHGQSLGRCISDERTMLAGHAPTAFWFENSVSGHASLLRRSLLDAVRPLPDGVYHDWWLALCAAGRGGVQYVARPLVRFRRHASTYSPVHPRGTARIRARQASRDWLEQHEHRLRAYGATGLPDSDRASTLATALRHALEQGNERALTALLRQHRDIAPRWSGVRRLDAERLVRRIRRHLRQARLDDGTRVSTEP